MLLCVHQHFRMSPYENVKGDVEMVDTLWFGFLCVCLCDVERIVLDYGEGNLQINLLSLTMHNKIVYVKSRHAAGNFDWQMFYGFKVNNERSICNYIHTYGHLITVMCKNIY